MARWLWAPLLLASSIAYGDPLRLEVTADTCSLDALEGTIDALAGRDAFDPAADRVVRVEGAQQDGAPAARVSMPDPSGHVRGPRVVTAASCDELVQAVSIVIAMALPPPEPPRRAPRPAPVAEVDEAAVSPPRPTSTTMRVFAAGAITGFGSHEQGLAGLEWRHGEASVMISVDHDVSSTIAVGPLAAIDLSRSDLQVAACARRNALAACPVLGAGVISASPTGLLRERSIASQVLCAGVVAVWEQPLAGRVALRAHVQADVLLTTTELQVDHMSVWRSPRFDGAAGVGVVVQFP